MDKLTADKILEDIRVWELHEGLVNIDHIENVLNAHQAHTEPEGEGLSERVNEKIYNYIMLEWDGDGVKLMRFLDKLTTHTEPEDEPRQFTSDMGRVAVANIPNASNTEPEDELKKLKRGKPSSMEDIVMEYPNSAELEDEPVWKPMDIEKNIDRLYITGGK